MRDILKRITNSLKNFFIPTVSTEYVIRNRLQFYDISEDEKWLYYWDNDFLMGQCLVKVSTNEQKLYFIKGGSK